MHLHLQMCKLTASNLGFLSSTAKCQCKIAPKERKNCGHPGISAADCRKAGCCFNASVPGVPWCFTAKPKKGNISTRNTDLPSVCLYRNVDSQGVLCFALRPMKRAQTSVRRPLVRKYKVKSCLSIGLVTRPLCTRYFFFLQASSSQIVLII